MIIALIGSNSYLISRRLDEIISQFVKKHGQLGLERIDGEEVDSESLIEAVQSTSLLSANKLVIVRDLSMNKGVQPEIEQIISSVDENCDVVFLEPNIDRRSSYFKVLKTKTQLEDMSHLDSPALAKWLVVEAKNQSAELSFSDASYLVERAGLSQALLASELDKLITYDPKISRQNIDLLVVRNPQSRVFDLLDAAFKGNKQRALLLYEEQRAQKVEPQEILGMIAWQLRLVALTKLAKGKSDSQVASDVGMSSFPFSKASSLARELNEGQVRTLINDAYQIDKLSKTKPIDLDEALKTYLTTI